MSGNTLSSQARSNGIIAATIFVIALIVRLLFLFSQPDAAWPHSALYEGDSPEWIRWAQALSRGRPYEFDLPLRSPGVAYLLYWLGAGDSGVYSYASWKVLWCVLSAATCSLSYLGFVTVFSRRVALIAAGFCVFSFGSYVAATSLCNETPYAFCLFAAILLTLRIARQPSMWLALVLALLHGSAMLLRAEHPPFMMAMTGWLLWQWKLRDQRAAISPPKSKHKAKVHPRKSRTASAPRLTLRNAIIMTAIILGGAAALCLPWSIRGAEAIHRFNMIPSQPIDYAHLRVPDAPANFPVVTWSTEAQAAMNALPAFTRAHSSYVLTGLVGRDGRTEVTLADVRRLFREYFHSTPEPLKSWALLSIKGPMDFAMANHPDAAGGYSNSALVLPGVTATIMNLSHTDHLYLLNHGYKAGLAYIPSDYGKWIGNLGRKLANFVDGFTLGYTARNLPSGPYGERRAVDLTTIYPRPVLWDGLIVGLFLIGVAMAIRLRVGGLWLLIISGKVIVALAFYGYARQAVSIFPAFALFIALPVDQLIKWARAKSGIGERAGLVFGGVVVATLILADVIAFTFPRPSAVEGPLRATPQWGPTAFECSERIVIKPAPGP
jgi:Dolichyl-phosphate-mannose-protein mannosyltransferase